MNDFIDYINNDKINVYTNSFPGDVVIEIKDPSGIIVDRDEVVEIIKALRQAAGLTL